jgi:ADP-heptose:LPS heptosyltransferase
MRNILIINRLGIGDVVVTTPLAKLIKEHNQAKVGFVVAAKSADLLTNHSFIDDVFAYSKKDRKKIISEIRQKNYNEAIIVDGRFSSTLLAWQSGCQLVNKGFEISVGASRWFVRKEREIKAIEDYSSYIQLINPEITSYEVEAVLGKPDAIREQYLSDWLAQQKTLTSKLVLVMPKSAAINKNWPITYFTKLNHFLNDRGIIPVYIGSANDAEYIKKIQGNMTNAAGMFSLRELPVIAKHAAFAISVCTGPMHIISTVKIPIIILYGPSDPVRWAPSNAIVLQSKLPCVPCERLDCTEKQGETCMAALLPEQVEAIIKELNWA